MTGVDTLFERALVFTVHGNPVSNNRNSRWGKFGTYKNPKADLYQQEVNTSAFLAKATRGWDKPEACAVTLDAFNVRLDIDNIPKSLLDGMQGVVYDNDSCVRELTVRKHKDRDGKRVVVTVWQAQPAKVAARKKADIFLPKGRT